MLFVIFVAINSHIKHKIHKRRNTIGKSSGVVPLHAGRIESFLHAVSAWASARPDILAVALVGSHARGNARADSDIDLVLLVEDPAAYLSGEDWPKRFGGVVRRPVEPYGRVTSLRVWYDDGREAEDGFTTAQWAERLLDERPRRTIRDGMRILFERHPLLSPLAGGQPAA
jgi:predicted nucleotidyltransferase